MTNPITAVLDQLAAHAEQIRRLDARQAASSAEASRRIADLARLASALNNHVTALAAQVSQEPPAMDADASTSASPHRPAPARRWLELSGDDREQAISALRAWVEQVYQPGYGQLAAALGPCWDQHDLCLHVLDILAELWLVLYQAGDRSPALLSAQAEFQARILPALAGQMSAETSRCRHARERLTTPRAARQAP